MSLNFFVFYKYLQHHEQASALRKHGDLADLFVDEESDLDPNVADYVDYKSGKL